MGEVNLLLITKVLFLLVMANGAPVIGKKILGEKIAFPIDGGLVLSDGQPLFGKSKTIRGVVLALLVTTTLAPLVNLEVHIWSNDYSGGDDRGLALELLEATVENSV